ncbi:DUF4395 domain-containing protein [Jeotgalibacillus soli]|uniref:DUF4395 domain-containing protein n=1 Tax=Jeotgalibacillus soli TaxID=889306 RepID=A0A0C2VUQ3_9BACL|nr:DUF4395 domain-containing protein [Jeotgalibacillus soli]KIL52637.1 hypothetical protein KP78_00080 [Jeotgalibacillus soli]
MTATPSTPTFIPRPLVRVNQWTIVFSVVLTWITGQYWLLLIPLLSGLGGLLFDFHPIMRFAKRFLRKPMNAYIPEDRDDQRFNQKIAVLCLTGAFVSYAAGWTAGAYAFTIMVATAAFIAILGFCVGCFIRFQWNQFQYRRRKQA